MPEVSIPRIIHQTWRDEAGIPAHVYRPEWRESWRRHHPGWFVRFWSDADLLRLAKHAYPEFVPLFENAKGIVKADIGRLLVLHLRGGLYVDLDYECRSSLEPLLTGGDLFVSSLPPIRTGRRNRGHYIHNALVAGVPGHPMFMNFATLGLQRWTDHPGLKTEHICGPKTFTEHADHYQPVQLPAEKVCPLDWRLPASDPSRNPDTWTSAHAIHWWKHHW